MTYQRETIIQNYGDTEYLAHLITGDEDKAYGYFANRIPSYGIINMGFIGANYKKKFKPVDLNITTDIMLRSLFSFTRHSIQEETTIRLFADGYEFLEQKITNEEMPYTFPPGAIINPNFTIEIQPSYQSLVMLYWQPVHVLSYIEVENQTNSRSQIDG